MPREFFIYSAADRKCTVKEVDSETTNECSDILDALDYVRRECGRERAKVTVYDPTGSVTYTHII